MADDSVPLLLLTDNQAPLDLREASFDAVVETLLTLLWQEALPKRRQRILKVAASRVEWLARAAAGGTSRREQTEAVRGALLLIGCKPIDFRKGKARQRLERRLPDPDELLAEYEALVARLRPLLSRRRRDGAETADQVFGVLMDLYPSKTVALRKRRQLAEKASLLSPAPAAHLLIGAMRGISLETDQVREALKSAREIRMKLASLRS